MQPSLAAAAETVIPADEAPGAAAAVEAYLDRERDRDLTWAVPLLDTLGSALDAAATARGGTDFAALAPADRTAVFADCLATPATNAAGEAMVRVAMEAYYGGNEAAPPPGWGVTSFAPVPARTTRIEPDLPPDIDVSALRASYDVVVIGSGAGGGVAADVLSAAGASVLLVERAARQPNVALRGDHLRDKRIPVYRPTVGPGPGNPRVVEHADGSTVTVDGDGNGFAWGLNAMCLGGGTRIWQAMAWRFMPEDFAMASTYGVPEGSTLADWPVDYAEMEPYYDRAEWEIGVSGETGALTNRTPRTRGYPMPPTSGGVRRRVLGSAAERLGWGWGPIPYAINSRPWGGRAACVGCMQCLGHTCPVDAKNGTHNTAVPRAVGTGNCDLLMGAQAVAIEHDAGVASAVRIVVDGPDGPVERAIRCGRVVVAAGAIETPRLLLASGLGNAHLGRHLHSHAGSMALGRSPEELPPFIGPSHSASTLDFVHHPDVAYGGGVLFDSPSQLPVMAAALASTAGIPAWGIEHKRWMRDGLSHLLGTMSITQEIPSAQAVVKLDPELRDRHGMPAARIRPHAHPATTDIVRQMAGYAVAWLRETGCEDIIDTTAIRRAPGAPAPASEHSCGTARMGDDPAGSATDRYGLLHGAGNVTVCDASLHPTNGSVNPTLTIFANAYRIADHLVATG